jgi:hypothetical protein
VRGRSQSKNGFPGKHVIDKVLHVTVRQFAEANQHDHHIGRRQMLHSRNVRLHVRTHQAGRGIDREQHRALEAMVLCHHLRQHGQAFFRPVLLIAADKYDVPALSRDLLNLPA